LVIGKNTIIKKAITFRVEGVPEGAEYEAMRRNEKKIPELAKLKDEFKGKLGLIFTKSTPIFKIKEIVEANKVAAPAKVGMISYLDVVVPAGPTGMEPA
jgi:large subunit ribosomal protein LP0